MVDTAIILAGGLGTRLRPLTDETPKPLLPMKGKPILQHTIENLKKHGIRNVILSVGYMADKIRNYFRDGSHLGVNITYCVENEPLGTGGAIKEASKNLTKPFITLNGDNLADFNFTELIEQHGNNKTEITLTLFPVKDVTQYGIAQIDGNIIKSFIEKPSIEEAPSNLNNAGAYVINPAALDILPAGNSSIERDCFEKLASQNQIGAYVHEGQWFPTDTLEKYNDACINFLPCIDFSSKNIIIADVDETICETNQEIHPEMADTIHQLIDFGCQFAVISGTNVEELQRMVSSGLTKEHHLLATTGTNYTLVNDSGCNVLYNHLLSDEDKYEITFALNKLIDSYNIIKVSEKNDQIIDRKSQITLSAIGRTAHLEMKKQYDPDGEKRKIWVEFLWNHLDRNKYDIKIGGTTSVDITYKGKTKEWGIKEFAKYHGFDLSKVIYFGDKIYPGGNDYEASKVVDCVAVNDHKDALVKIKEFLDFKKKET